MPLGTLTGSLTSNSFDIYPVGDPPDVNSAGDSTYTFSYYLASQYQVSSASASQTASPTYTYTQVSGTTNQANASFSFSGTTPSTAVFIPYESGTSTLKTDSTSITFTPSFTVNNPYYTYAQNQLVPSLTGASSGSLNPSSNTASWSSPEKSGCDMVNVADTSDPEFWNASVGAVTDGATLP